MAEDRVIPVHKSITEWVTMMHETVQAGNKEYAKKEELEKDKAEKAYKENAESIQNYFAGQAKAVKNRASLLEQAKNGFISAALFKVYKNSFDEQLTSTDKDIARNLFTEFVSEQGAGRLLINWETKNTTIAELGRICSEAYCNVRDALPSVMSPLYENEVEDMTQEPLDVLKLDKASVDDFYQNLIDADTDTASKMIHDRVNDAITSFVDQNAKTRAACEEIIANAKEKMDAVAAESQPEDEFTSKPEDRINAIQAECTRQINHIKRFRPKSPFHYVVEAITKASLTDDGLKSRNVNESKVDMDNIIHQAKLIYTFIETLNTLEAVDSSYIKAYIESAVNEEN